MLLTLVAAMVFAAPKPPAAELATSNVQENQTPAADVELKADQIREGIALANQSGQFRLTGDCLTFFWSSGNRRLIGLENLSLERIAKLVSQSPEPLDWTVSGIITEFQGSNYLLVTRAVLRSRPAGRAAGRVPADSRR